MSKFDDDMARGCLPTGEPLECAYGVGWWTEMPEEEPEPEPELKPCPFCGAMPETDGKLVQCYLMPCDFRRFKMPVESWNTRPIEDALNARIAELEAERRWIPVSERLPLLRNSKAVLVYTKSGETYSGLYLGNNEWTGLLHDFREGEVTHWMPLPSAPESEDE